MNTKEKDNRPIVFYHVVNIARPNFQYWNAAIRQ